MHELSTAMRIAEEAAARAKNKKVRCVHVEVGFLRDAEEIASCYELATEGTPLRGSRISVKRRPLTPTGGRECVITRVETE